MTFTKAIRMPFSACGIAGAVAILAFAPFAFAQDNAGATPEAPGAVADTAEVAVDPDRVYARVDGTPITENDLIVAAEDYAAQLGRSPGDVPLGELLNVLIDMRLLAKAAEAADLDDDDAVKSRLAFARMQTLRNAYLRNRALAAVNDEKVQAQFDKETAEFEPEDERHLRHILVETEEEAKAIVEDLKAGGDFAAIAADKSKDPGSGPNGGDLDFIGRGVTVPEFETAAFALEVGEITDEPVQSQFGWHVIKLEETRKSSPPDFASQAARIRTDMLREFVTNEIAELRAAADIQIVQPEAPAADADSAEDAPAETPAQ